MYIMAVVLFLVPCCLLLTGWSHAIKGWQKLSEPQWRINCMTASLLIASCAILTGIAFIFAWLHSGGNPHGMGTPPGVWQTLGRVFRWMLVVSVALAILGKGKGRFLVLGAAVSAVLVPFAVMMLDID
jgi:hypothetical protein